MDRKIRSLVIAALFAALICVATMVITVPLPGRGYVNTGDAFVLLCACMMGLPWAAGAAAVGSAMADVLLGYAVYAPGTFVIKGLMAVAVCLVYRAFSHLRQPLRAMLAGLAGEVVMVLGYFVYELALFHWTSAVSGIPGNIVQAVGGAVLATVAVSLLCRNETVVREFPHLK